MCERKTRLETRPAGFLGHKAAQHIQGAINARRTRPLITEGRGHPTTAELDYSEAEVEFLKAVEHWKVRTGRKFPTVTEILGIARGLGYTKGLDPLDAGSTLEFDTASMAAAAQRAEERGKARAATSAWTARPFGGEAG